MKHTVLTIQGMSCGGCVASVKRVLGRMPGVQVGDVKVGSAQVTIDEARVSEDALRAAIDAAGFVLQGVRDE